MAWIEVHQGLFRHRKTASLATALDVPRMSAGGHMVCLWLWSLDNAPTGDLTALSPALIAFGAEWEGDPNVFTDALVDSGFLDRIDGILTIHDWDDYAGRLIDKRRRDAERKRLVRRTVPGRPTDRPQTSGVPYLTVPNLTNIYIPEWLQILRDIPGWTERGKAHEATLFAWIKRKSVSSDQSERSAIGLAKVKTTTLQNYANLARAFQDRINKDYDSPRVNSQHSSVPNSINPMEDPQAAFIRQEAKEMKERKERAEAQRRDVQPGSSPSVPEKVP